MRRLPTSRQKAADDRRVSIQYVGDPYSAFTPKSLRHAVGSRLCYSRPTCTQAVAEAWRLELSSLSSHV